MHNLHLPQLGNTALHVASSSSCANVVRLLIGNGCDVNTQNNVENVCIRL